MDEYVIKKNVRFKSIKQYKRWLTEQLKYLRRKEKNPYIRPDMSKDQKRILEGTVGMRVKIRKDIPIGSEEKLADGTSIKFTTDILKEADGHWRMVRNISKYPEFGDGWYDCWGLCIHRNWLEFHKRRKYC